MHRITAATMAPLFGIAASRRIEQAAAANPVSYTHLTLPTIYSV